MFKYEYNTPLAACKKKFKMEDQGHKVRMYTRVKGSVLINIVEVFFKKGAKA